MRIVPPAGTRLAPVGPVLIDEAGETVILIVMTDIKYSLESNSVYRMLYKRAPERISTPALSGNLYRRTRAADGGGWDGWFFTVPRGQKVLEAMVTYTGSSAAAFDKVREHLLTISWDESIADPELALGAKLAPRGLRLVSGIYGALVYNPSGQLGAAGPVLMVQAVPISAARLSAVFPQGCEQLLGKAFAGKAFAPPAVRERNDLQWCETWSASAEAQMRYLGVVRLPNGGLITAMGTSSLGQFDTLLPAFRAAVEDLQPLPRP